MNNRFKFRVWDKAIGEMSYDVCIGFITDGLKRDWVCADTTCGQIDYTDKRLKDIEIMQSTVLKDKNGKLIYEGDIVRSEQYPFKCEGKYNYSAEICWSKEGACFYYYVFKNKGSEVVGISTGNTGHLEDYDDWEVIGNIYENADLLQEECE